MSRAFHHLDRRFMADRAVGADLVVVSTPSLHLGFRVIKAPEPVSVQAFGPEFAAERLDKGIVRRLPGPGEVENDVFLVGSQVEITGDELRALIDPDRLRIAELAADAFQRLHEVFAAVAESRIDRRREAREGIDDRQNT